MVFQSRTLVPFALVVVSFLKSEQLNVSLVLGSKKPKTDAESTDESNDEQESKENGEKSESRPTKGRKYFRFVD